MTQFVTIAGVRMTAAAAENVRETGADVAADLAAVRNGSHSFDSLIEHCLDGADEDRVEGWHDYVEAVTDAAKVAS